MSGSGSAPPIPTQPYELFVKQQRDLARSRQEEDDDERPALVRGGPGFTSGGGGGGGSGGGGSTDNSHDRADRSTQFGRLGDLDTNSFHAVSIDTPLSSNNPGFRMLVKMGCVCPRLSAPPRPLCEEVDVCESCKGALPTLCCDVNASSTISACTNV